MDFLGPSLVCINYKPHATCPSDLSMAQDSFNINDYVQVMSSKTRSFNLSKLVFTSQPTNNHLNFIYFNQVVKLWNALSELGINCSTYTTPEIVSQGLFINKIYSDLAMQ